jgi:hypothetical protein
VDGARGEGVQHHAVPAVPPRRGAGAVESGREGRVEVVRGGSSVGELGGDVGGVSDWDCGRGGGGSIWEVAVGGYGLTLQDLRRMKWCMVFA